MFSALFSDRVFYRRLLTLMLPIAFQNFMLAAIAACDALMLGRFDQNAMAAVSLATQVQFVQGTVFFFAVFGAAVILGAQYWGRGDRRTMEDIFCLILRLSGAVSLGFCLACELFPEALMRVFTDEAALIPVGAGYLRIAGWSYLLVGVSQCYLTMMKVSDHVHMSAFISSAAVVLNIFLNWVFIFGKFGMAPLGADGAAWATLSARGVELLLAVGVSCGATYLRPSLPGLLRRNRQLARDFNRCVVPLLGGSILWSVGFTAYTAALGHLGTDAAAANGLAAVVRDVMCCICVGVASGGASAERMPLSDEARRLLYGMMLIMAVYMIARCITTIVINGVFAAGNDTRFDVYSLAVCMWGVALPLTFIGAFVLHWPVLAVYACTCLDEIGKIPWVIHHHRRYLWVKDLTRDRSAA